MSRRGNLLCIDDDPTSLDIRKMLLERFGYKVCTSTSGREALKLFSKRRFDAVLLDYQMPEMNGAQVAREMRRLRPQVPILMLSAYNALPDNVTRLVNAFVSKTDPIKFLVGKIEQLLALKTSSSGDPAWVLAGALALAAVGALAIEKLFRHWRGKSAEETPLPKTA